MNMESAKIQAAIRFAGKAFDEAFTATRGDKNAAEEAWVAALPVLTDRPSVRAYIACVAVGFAHRHLTASEAKTMLYTAQLQLAALSERKKP